MVPSKVVGNTKYSLTAKIQVYPLPSMKIPRFESFVWGSECGCSVAVGAGPHPTNNSGLGMVFLTKKKVTLRSVPNV